jgi:hypothetical protein
VAGAEGSDVEALVRTRQEIWITAGMAVVERVIGTQLVKGMRQQIQRKWKKHGNTGEGEDDTECWCTSTCVLQPSSRFWRSELLQQYRQRITQLEPVAGGVCEEESALSNKASILDSRSASRLFSFFSSFKRFSLSSDAILSLSVSCSMS